MRSFLTRGLSITLLVAAPMPALAQGLPTSQPPYLLVIREDVKVGRGADHAKLEAGWVAAYERAKSQDYYLGMESMTGTEAWFVIPAASYSALGEMQERERGAVLGPELARLRRADGDLLNGWRGVGLRARPDLSAGTYPDMSKQRHWRITIFRMRPGGADVFASIAKAYGAGGERAGRTLGYRVYEVAEGMPSGTFFVFSSVGSFADLDKLHTEDVAAIQEMIRNPDEKLLAGWYDKLISSESYVLSLSPEMSYVPADVRASDPAFWKKPAPAKTAPPKPASTQ